MYVSGRKRHANVDPAAIAARHSALGESKAICLINCTQAISQS